MTSLKAMLVEAQADRESVVQKSSQTAIQEQAALRTAQETVTRLQKDLAEKTTEMSKQQSDCDRIIADQLQVSVMRSCQRSQLRR